MHRSISVPRTSRYDHLVYEVGEIARSLLPRYSRDTTVQYLLRSLRDIGVYRYPFRWKATPQDPLFEKGFYADMSFSYLGDRSRWMKTLLCHRYVDYRLRSIVLFQRLVKGAWTVSPTVSEVELYQCYAQSYFEHDMITATKDIDSQGVVSLVRRACSFELSVSTSISRVIGNNLVNHCDQLYQNFSVSSSFGELTEITDLDICVDAQISIVSTAIYYNYVAKMLTTVFKEKDIVRERKLVRTLMSICGYLSERIVS